MLQTYNLKDKPDKSINLQNWVLPTIYRRGRRPTARAPHFARQAISNGTHKFHVLHTDFVMIHTDGILTLTCIRICMLLAHWMIWDL